LLAAIYAEAAAQHKRITVSTRLDGMHVLQTWVIESTDRVCFSQRAPARDVGIEVHPVDALDCQGDVLAPCQAI
jgi:hypothetical protein